MSEENGNAEKSFNDAELQDIMNEIESLEKEFVEEGGAEVAAEVTAEATAEETPEPQPEEEAPVAETPAEEPETVEASSEEESEDLVSEAENYEDENQPEPAPQAEVEVEVEANNVVAMPTQKAAPAAGGEGYMQFSGQGDMDMQLNFQLGSETATVNVSGGSLNVKLAGVELQLTENGCEVNMEGGVKFSVPLTGSQAQGKKAA